MIAGISVAVYALLVVSFGLVKFWLYRGGPVDDGEETGSVGSTSDKGISDDYESTDIKKETESIIV